MKLSLISLIAFAVSLPMLVIGIFTTLATAVGENLHSLLFRHMARNGMILGLEPLDEIKEAVVTLGKDYKASKEVVQDLATKAFKEAEKAGTLSVETKAAVDKALSEQGAIITEMAQKLDKVGQVEKAAEFKSTGRQVTDSQAFKDFKAAGGFKAVGHAMNIAIKEITGLTGAAGGVLIAPDRQNGLIVAPNRRMTVRDLLTPGRTSSNLVEFFRELLFTNNAAPVSETILKPESNITFAEAEAKVVTIAHWIKATKQIIDDVPAMESFIDGRLRYGLELVEEAQLLKGSGSGNNLNGIYTQATDYALPSGATAVTTRIDVLRMMLLQAELAEYPATGIVLHPTEWANIEVQKTTDGAYLWSNPTTTNGQRLWGRDVVVTQAMTTDTALVGAFRLGAQIFDREDANVVMSSENSDDFVKNRVTIRAEERLALAVYRPAAFVRNTNLVA